VRNPVGGRGEERKRLQSASAANGRPAAVCFWLLPTFVLRPSILSLVTLPRDMQLSLPFPPSPRLHIAYNSGIGVHVGEQPVTRGSSQTATNSLLILKREPHGPIHMHTSTTLQSCHCPPFPLPPLGPTLLSSERCGRHFWPPPVSALAIIGLVRTPRALPFAYCHVDCHSHASIQRLRPTGTTGTECG
jgi:hypothetical protein